MGPLQFSGSPWFLLLLAPGLFILWRQYRAGSRRSLALPLLQGAALVLLVLSLTGPELVRTRAEFHDPAVAILRDRSGSFDGGAYLGLAEEYRAVEEAIAAEFRKRGFEVRVADFHERAWPVSGFREDGAGEPSGSPDGDVPLTGFASLADFLDTAGGPNLQGAFLFTDGRANLDSGKAARKWPVPLFPVALPVRSVSEVQPERVALEEGPGGEGGIEAEWMPVGPQAAGPELRILQDGRVIFRAELPLGEEGGEKRSARIPWKPKSGSGALGVSGPKGPAMWKGGGGGFRAVVQPRGGRGNFDPWNDTLPVASPSARGERRIAVIKPLRSLDEKAMMDFLRAWEDVRVETPAAEEIAGAGAGDQIWVDASLPATKPGVLEALRATPASVIVYARHGSLPDALAGIRLSGLRFTAAAEVRVSRSAADVFPPGVVRLGSISSGALELPASGPPWREAAAATEGGRRGVLAGWFPLGPGKEALFLALPRQWDLLFDPQSDFAVRDNLAQTFRAAYRLAERELGAVKAHRPAVAHAGVPFDLEFAVPAATTGGEGGPGSLDVVARAGGKDAEVWTLKGPGPGTFRLEGRVLPAGSYTLELRRGGDPIWSDSLRVAPKASLELARIGFDRDGLSGLASRSGGRVLAPDPAPAGVASWLPDLPGAQIRVERTEATRLYNTRLLFLLVVALLTASWLLRKRWNLD
jgi:hypothetical protein